MGMRARLGLLLLGAAAPSCGGSPPASGAAAARPPAEATWRALEPGLELASFRGGVRVVRADPRRFAPRLCMASAEGEPRTPREWARTHRLAAVINAGMYAEDGRTSVGLMRSSAHVNNPRLGRDRAVLAFEPRRAGTPAVRIIDRECDDFRALSGRYGTLVQGIRMLSCKGENVWEPQPARASTSAIGLDAEGRLLLIHGQERLSTHDLIEALRGLPLGLRRALYTEGGPQAQLYVRAGGEEVSVSGEPESSLLGAAAPLVEWPLPNVVGLARN
jgi:hypothetical protein